jgi:hypothetical protein
MNKTFFYPFILFLTLAIVAFFFGFFTSFTESSFIFIRPITVFQYTVFLAFAFGLLAFKTRIEKRLTLNKKEFYMALGFFFAMASLFEVFWNFFYWFSLYSLSAALSPINNISMMLPYNPVTFQFVTFLNATEIQTSGLFPLNLNVASKGWFAIFFGAVYWIYFVSKLKVEKPEELQ